jgi:hypothetical protein
MIRSHACQRNTPWTAGIGPSSTMRVRKRLVLVGQLLGPPGDGLLTICRSMPPISAARAREWPSSTAAIANGVALRSVLHPRCQAPDLLV